MMLRTTKYKDGTNIPNVTDNTAWINLSTGAYCNYNNSSDAGFITTYGHLYNWYAVNTGKLAPSGWHVPTDAEWTTLTDYLGGENVAVSRKLKEIGTTHWNSPNTGATNETGFTALPGGCRDSIGAFGDFGDIGNWWSATEGSTNFAWGRDMGYDYGDVSRNNSLKVVGLSIRCIMD